MYEKLSIYIGKFVQIYWNFTKYKFIFYFNMKVYLCIKCYILLIFKAFLMKWDNRVRFSKQIKQ